MNSKRAFLLFAFTIGLALGACQPKAAETLAPQPPANAPQNEEPPAVQSPPTAAPPAPTDDPALFATLSELAGQVGIKQAGASAFAPAQTGAKLQPNGQVQTGADGKARLDLSSGTIIRVAPSSLFTLVSNEHTEAGLWTKITMELGKVFVILNGGKTEVQTPAGVAAVQGSYLYVEFGEDGETLILTCLEGNCSFTAPDGKSVSFTDGQKVVVRKDPATGEWIIEQQPMNENDYNNWLENNPEAQELVERGLKTAGGGGGGGESCMVILQPPTGAQLPFQGRINFEWSPQPGAAKYLVKFINPNGAVIAFETSNPNLSQYIEGFLPQEGEMTWWVTALDENGGEICSTQPSSFVKPDSKQKWQKPEKEEPQSPYNPYYGW